MGFFSSSKKTTNVNWNDLVDVNELNDIYKLSEEKPVLILKHSTRCSISAMAKNRLELYWDSAVGIEPYYLDLLKHRDISNELASKFNIMHESPQVLLIKNGACIYHAEHGEIDFNKLKQLV